MRGGQRGSPGHQHAVCAAGAVKLVLSDEASFMVMDMLRKNRRPDETSSAQPDRLPVYWKTGTLVGDPPQITSPLHGGTYALRLAQLGRERIACTATTDADVHALYWFVNDAYIGHSAPGQALYWQPPAAGSYTARVGDEHGRSNQRPLGVSLVE